MRAPLIVTSGLAVVVAVCVAALAGSAGANTTRAYGGLGATVKAFYAQNAHGSGTPGLGVAYYKVTATKHGRVTRYRVTTNFKPAPSARERVSLLGGIDLPSDARETNLNGTYCLVWRSKRLKGLIGMEYAAATTTRFDRTTAQMRAERKPRC